jgi:hypothetical protein
VGIRAKSAERRDQERGTGGRIQAPGRLIRKKKVVAEMAWWTWLARTAGAALEKSVCLRRGCVVGPRGFDEKDGSAGWSQSFQVFRVRKVRKVRSGDLGAGQAQAEVEAKAINSKQQQQHSPRIAGVRS